MAEVQDMVVKMITAFMMLLIVAVQLRIFRTDLHL